MTEIGNNGDESLEVMVRIPKARLAEFYTLVGKWLGGEIVVPDDLPVRANLRAWDDTHTSKKHAFQVFQRLRPQARRVFEILVAEPGKRYEADELSRLAGIQNGRYGIAGVLGLPSRRFAEFNRPLPIEIEERSGSVVYWIHVDLAPMIRDSLGGILPGPPKPPSV